MSSGTTYSRTSGSAILATTWQAIQARHPTSALSPHERTSWEEGTPDDRLEFLRLMQLARTTAPGFLQFDLAKDPYRPGSYPSAVPEVNGFPANGHLGTGLTLAGVAFQLAISQEQLKNHLANFSGLVSVIKLTAGTTIYRTVGLTAKGVSRGCVTNQPLGPYWEPVCPSTYANVDAWRQATAVKAEWNGDFGFVAVTLKSELIMLSGVVGMQLVDAVNRQVLPGGAQQLFIPNIAVQDKELGRMFDTELLVNLIKPTLFGSARP